MHDNSVYIIYIFLFSINSRYLETTKEYFIYLSNLFQFDICLNIRSKLLL